MVIRELINLIGFRVNESQWRRAEGRVQALQNKMRGFGQKMSLMFTLPFTLLTAKLGSTLSMFEQMNVAFETMVGSAEEADELVRNMLDFAAKTPFEIKEIGGTVKQLLAMGSTADSVLDDLRMLGDVASGLSVPVSRLALNFGQVRTQGKLTGRELRDFSVLGVNLREELSKLIFGTEEYTNKISDMVSKGQISFEQVSDAFKQMTSEGGKFYNLMIKQSKTLGGMWSNFMDIITLSIKDLEKTLLPALKKILLTIIAIFDWVNNHISPELKTVIFFMAAFVAVLAPLLLAFSALISLGKFVVGAFSLIGAAAAKASIPVAILIGKFLLIALAVIAAVAAVALFIEDLAIYLRGGESFIGRFLEPWETLAPKIKKSLEPIIYHLTNAWNFIKELFYNVVRFIGHFIDDDIEAAAEDVEEIIKNLLLIIGALLYALLPLLWKFLLVLDAMIMRFFGVLGETIVRSLQVLWELVKQNVAQAAKDILMTFVDILFGPIDNMVMGAIRGLQRLGMFRSKPEDFGFGADVTQMGAPYDPAAVLAGGTGTGGGGRLFNKNLNINAQINANVPEGTDQEVIDEARRQSMEAAYEVFNEEVKDLILNFSEDE